MSMLTYILLSSLSLGIGQKFDEETIKNNFLKCFIVMIFELFINKLSNFEKKKKNNINKNLRIIINTLNY